MVYGAYPSRHIKLKIHYTQIQDMRRRGVKEIRWILRCLCVGIMGSVHVLWGGCCRDPPSRTSHGDCRPCDFGGGDHIPC